MFRRLGVFVGGASLEAAGGGLPGGDGDAGGDAARARRRAARLDAARVAGREEPAAAGGAGEATPASACWRRSASTPWSAWSGRGGRGARRRDARYFLGLAEAAGPGWGGPFAERGRWLDRLEVEHDNFRQALAWSQTAPACAEDGGALGLRPAAALGQFWRRSGHWSEGRRGSPARWPCPRPRDRRRAGEASRTPAPWRRGRASSPPARALEAGGRLARAGRPAGPGGGAQRPRLAPEQLGERLRRARRRRRCVALCRALDDRPGLARALAGWATPSQDAARSEPRRAPGGGGAVGGEPRALPGAGGRRGASEPLFMLAWLARVRGDYGLPGRTSSRPVALRRTAPPGGPLAMALLHLGSVACSRATSPRRGRTSRRPGSFSAPPGTAWAGGGARPAGRPRLAGRGRGPRRRRSRRPWTSPGRCGGRLVAPTARRAGDLARQAGDLAGRRGATARAWRSSSTRPTAAPTPSGRPGPWSAA